MAPPCRCGTVCSYGACHGSTAHVAPCEHAFHSRLAARFPIMSRRPADCLSVPWSAMDPHERQAQRNHGQSLWRLATRGGLDPTEAVAVLEDRAWSSMDYNAAVERLRVLVEGDLRSAATGKVP